MEKLQEWVERFDPGAIFERLTDAEEHYRETRGWVGNSYSQGCKKPLPYHDWWSFRGLQVIGGQLYHESIPIRGAIEKLISYFVGKGHTYTFHARRQRGQLQTAEPSRETKMLMLDMDDIVKDTIERLCWPQFQEETARRALRDGEVWRRVDKTDADLDGSDNEVDIWHEEPWIYRSPHDPPREVRAGKYGIVRNQKDARKVEFYWRYTGDMNLEDQNKTGGTGERYEEFDRVLPNDVQHMKYGVDENDPRGIPLFYMCYMDACQLQEVDRGAVELLLTMAAYAAVHLWMTGTDATKIESMRAGQFRKKKHAELAESSDSPVEVHKRRAQPGDVVDVVGGDVKLLGNGLTVDGAISLMNFKYRKIASVASIPYFIMSGDAESAGARNTLLASEGPFDRYVTRFQSGMGKRDVAVFKHAIELEMGIDPKEANAELWSKVAIRPQFPVVRSRDVNLESERIRAEVQSQLLSKKSARAELGYDPAEEESQIKEESEQQEEMFAIARQVLTPNPVNGRRPQDRSPGSGGRRQPTNPNQNGNGQP